MVLKPSWTHCIFCFLGWYFSWLSLCHEHSSPHPSLLRSKVCIALQDLTVARASGEYEDSVIWAMAISNEGSEVQREQLRACKRIHTKSQFAHWEESIVEGIIVSHFSVAGHFDPCMVFTANKHGVTEPGPKDFKLLFSLSVGYCYLLDAYTCKRPPES